MLAFCIFGAAVFAEPTVTNVEEVVGLVHGQKDVERARGVGWTEFHLSPRPTPNSLNPLLLLAPGIGRFCQAYRHGNATAVADDLYLHLIANRMLVE